MKFFAPSPSIQYFSNNNITFNLFAKYFKQAIIKSNDRYFALDIIVHNCSFNKEYIINFINSKELVDKVFDNLHQNHVAFIKLNSANSVANYITKSEFESSYYYSKIPK